MKEGVRREEVVQTVVGGGLFVIAVGLLVCLFVCCLEKIQGQGEKN